MSAIGSVAHDSRRRLWRNFCDANCIVSNGVPFFSLSPNGYVEVMRYGRNARPILKRSAEMQSLIQNTVAAIIAAPQGHTRSVSAPSIQPPLSALATSIPSQPSRFAF